VVFDVRSGNAMTWAMLWRIVARRAEPFAADNDVRVAVFRGAAAPLLRDDIQQFPSLRGRRRIAYEKRINAAISQLSKTSPAVIAVVESALRQGRHS